MNDLTSDVKKGTKILEDEAKTLDPKGAVVMNATEADVEGQDCGSCGPIQRVECPWCGLRGRALVDPDYPKYVQCSGCARAFRV